MASSSRATPHVMSEASSIQANEELELDYSGSEPDADSDHSDVDYDYDSLNQPLPPGTRIDPPRRRRMGGYVLPYETVWEWAKRLWEIPENDMDCWASAWMIVNKHIQPRSGGLRLTPLGDDNFEVCMVITQSASFNGWKGMPESEIPQFTPIEIDKRVKQFLEAEGYEGFEYKTMIE